MNRKPKFVIIGTGRCGTGFTANLLSEIGVPCGHESFWGMNPIKRQIDFHGRVSCDGDASWLALPDLESGRQDIQCSVFHQVRHPIEVIRSLIGIGFFSSHHKTPHAEFARRNFRTETDELLTCMKWWVEWNQRCEDVADLTFPVEHIKDYMPNIVAHFDKTLPPQWELTTDYLVNAGVNSRERKNFTKDDLPEGSRKDQLFDLASYYGYDL